MGWSQPSISQLVTGHLSEEKKVFTWAGVVVSEGSELMLALGRGGE